MPRLFPALENPADKIALTVEQRSLTWKQLASACRAHADVLKSRGISRGAHVGVWTQNALETLVACVANAACGVVTVPIDPKLGPMELTHMVSDSKPVLMFAADAAAVAGKLSNVETAQFSIGESNSDTWFRDVDDAPLLILYTSGTTGLPKGAIITARNVATNLDGLASAWKWTAADTVVHALPMFHVHGLVLGLFGSIRQSGSMQWVPKFSPEAIANALSTGQTMLFAVPTMYHRLSEAAETAPAVLEGLRHARVLVSGSAALANRDQVKVEALTGRRVLERYGMTETLINCALRVDGTHVVGAVGAPVDGVELRLVDDTRTPLSAQDGETIGEIAVRGAHVFAGYLNRPDATAAVMDADGWFFTGDLATIRPDGLVRIVGRRATDLIKCGGYKVGAGEVEAALLEHPNVREAAVLGMPDADLGEKIVAYVVTSAPVSAGDLQNHVAQQLSPHKRPREIHFVNELPRNAMGKVLKTKLKGHP